MPKNKNPDIVSLQSIYNLSLWLIPLSTQVTNLNVMVETYFVLYIIHLYLLFSQDSAILVLVCLCNWVRLFSFSPPIKSSVGLTPVAIIGILQYAINARNMSSCNFLFLQFSQHFRQLHLPMENEDSLLCMWIHIFFANSQMWACELSCIFTYNFIRDSPPGKQTF